MADLFPEDVRRFIDGHVASVDQLELLRLLWEAPEAVWTGADLAADLQTSPAEAVAQLTALQRRGLLQVEAGGAEPLYRYGARDAELDGLLRTTLQHYRERPVSMIKFVAARAKDPLRSFADAFRVRPPEGG